MLGEAGYAYTHLYGAIQFRHALDLDDMALGGASKAAEGRKK